MGFQSVPNLVTLNCPVAVIMHYFMQNDSFGPTVSNLLQLDP